MTAAFVLTCEAIMKTCPYCAEEIKDEAVKCKHCGEWLNPMGASKGPEDAAPSNVNAEPQGSASLTKCRFCSHAISWTAITCPVCGKNCEINEQTKYGLPKSGLKAAAGVAAVVLMGPVGILAASSTLLADSYSNRSFKKIARENAAIDSFYAGDYMVLVTEMEFILTYNMFGSGIYRRIPRNSLRAAILDENKTRSGSLLMSDKAEIVIKYEDAKVEKSLRMTIKGKTASDLANYSISKFKEYTI
jgi:hypothetical protein